MASDEFERMASLLGAVIEGQKRSVASLAGVAEKYDSLQGSLDRVSRRISRLQESQVELRNDVKAVDHRAEALASKLDAIESRFDTRLDAIESRFDARLDAIGQRLDEIDSQIDRSFNGVRELQIDVASQQNEILNAMQAALAGRIDIGSLIERIEALERKTGMM